MQQEHFPSFICPFASIEEFEASIQEKENKLTSQLWWLKLPVIGRKIHPYGPFHLWWRFCLIPMLVLVCLGWPFVIAFEFELLLKYWQGALAFIFDLFLLSDLFMNFFVAFYDPNDHLRLITDFTKIKHRYFKTWFIVDLCSSLPFEFIYLSNGDGSEDTFDFFDFLRILKILSFVRLMRYINVYTKYQVTHDRNIRFMWRIFRLVCLMIISVHFAACLWFLVGRLSYENEESTWVDGDNADIMGDNIITFRKYVASAYWSVVTLSTVGFGDYTPQNINEEIVAIFCIILGTGLFAYFIGAVSSLVTEGDQIKTVRQEKLEQTQAFCEHKKLPSDLSRAIIAHTKYHWNHNFLFDSNQVIENLPSYLRTDVNRHLGERFFSNLKFFEHLSLETKGVVSTNLFSISANQGKVLFRVKFF